MPYDIETTVTRNEDLGGGNYLIEFVDERIASEMGPAQFLMIGIPGSETLLRRPYSVCGLPGTFEDRPAGALQVLYKVVGHGTGLLATLKAGATLRVLAPLGRGFEAPEQGRRPLMVAGGIGSAPFPAWLQALEGRTERPLMIYGARSCHDLPLRNWFAERSELIVTTDDGSAGEHGRVTVPLARLFEEHDPQRLHLYACGPDPMLKAVAKMAIEAGAICDLALEAHMACGFGVCLGCVVPTHGADGELAYERVCMEGPVMRAERMNW